MSTIRDTFFNLQMQLYRSCMQNKKKIVEDNGSCMTTAGLNSCNLIVSKNRLAIFTRITVRDIDRNFCYLRQFFVVDSYATLNRSLQLLEIELCAKSFNRNVQLLINSSAAYLYVVLRIIHNLNIFS